MGRKNINEKMLELSEFSHNPHNSGVKMLAKFIRCGFSVILSLLLSACSIEQTIDNTPIPTSTIPFARIPTATSASTVTPFPTTTPRAKTIYLSDLTAFSAFTNSPIEAGVFPETKSDLGIIAGQPLAWHNRSFPHGFYVGADTTLTYDISDQHSFLFHVDVTRIFSIPSCGDGIDFVVLGDMAELARVHIPQDSEEVIPMNVDVRGVNRLTLLVDNKNNYDCDDSIWGDPILFAYVDPSEAPVIQPSPTSTSSPSEPLPEKMVWAYYYGWYQPLYPWMWWNDPRWIDHPVDRYNSMDINVIQNQISQAKSAGIDGFVVLWLGIDNVGNSKQLNLLLQAAAKENFKVIVSYEFPQSINKSISDLEYLLVNFSNRPAYMRVENEPVVFLFNNADLGSAKVWQDIFNSLEKMGLHGFFVSSGYSVDDLSVFDGIFEYSPREPSFYTAFNQEFGSYLQKHPEATKLWVASVMPGFDNTPNVTAGVDTYKFIDPQNGQYYRQSLQTAIDSGAPWILICTWNEYTENTEIEPSEKLGTLRLEITQEIIPPWKANH